MARTISLILILLVLAGCQYEATLNGEKIVKVVVSEVGEDWDDIGPALVTYTIGDQEELQTFVQAIKKSKKNPGTVDVAKADYLLKLELEDGSDTSYFLWLESDYGAIMDVKNTNTIYSLSSPVLKKLNTYTK